MEIVQYPHPSLYYQSVPVTGIDSRLRGIAREMFELMYASKGIGLAANQVGLPYRLFVLNLASDPNDKEEEVVFINPEILKRSGNEEGEEGCLSFPELYGSVKRSSKIVVDAFDLGGNNFQYELDELACRAVLHECDHLDGVLFIDRMTDAEREKTQPFLDDFEKQFRAAQAAGEILSDEKLLEELDTLAEEMNG